MRKKKEVNVHFENQQFSRILHTTKSDISYIVRYGIKWVVEFVDRDTVRATGERVFE